MKKSRYSDSQIVRRLNEKEEAERKENITFRLTKRVIDQFRDKCKIKEKAMAAVLEQLLIEFNRD